MAKTKKKAPAKKKAEVTTEVKPSASAENLSVKALAKLPPESKLFDVQEAILSAVAKLRNQLVSNIVIPQVLKAIDEEIDVDIPLIESQLDKLMVGDKTIYEYSKAIDEQLSKIQDIFLP